jgi:CheY-like chemotaxis protein
VKQLLLHLVLADDDFDDCIFFKEALEELSHATALKTVNNGVALMRLLREGVEPLPHVIYLDLNMPLKTGFECLAEIKQTEKLKDVPVIIFSTSFNAEIAEKLREQGAAHYIRKPGDFADLKKILSQSLDLLTTGKVNSTAENFVLKVS